MILFNRLAYNTSQHERVFMYLTFSDWAMIVSGVTVSAWITYAISECTYAAISWYDEL